MALPGTTNYQELRAAYDLAFRELARELQHMNLLQICDDAESSQLAQAEQRLRAAQSCYLERRNALASHLLSGRSGAIATKRFVERRAYLLWEDAGRPNGNDQAYWFRAEASYASAGSPDPIASF